METVIGSLLFFGLILFAVWRQKKDREINGEITKDDRLKTYISTVAWFFGLLATFQVYAPAYVVVVAIFFAFSKIFGMGTGKRGTFRQMRDGGFIGAILSLPVCFMLWAQNGQT